MTKVASVQEAIERYGDASNGTWANEVKWCSLYFIPNEIYLINSEGFRQKHIYGNSDMIPALHEAFLNVIARRLTDDLKTYDGCLMVRDVRGEPGKPSAHSWALAVDFNAFENELGQVGAMPDELGQCFIDAGFAWGKNFPRRDFMHMSFSWE
jgi:hypothetical protein